MCSPDGEITGRVWEERFSCGLLVRTTNGCRKPGWAVLDQVLCDSNKELKILVSPPLKIGFVSCDGSVVNNMDCSYRTPEFSPPAPMPGGSCL